MVEITAQKERPPPTHPVVPGDAERAQHRQQSHGQMREHLQAHGGAGANACAASGGRRRWRRRLLVQLVQALGDQRSTRDQVAAQESQQSVHIKLLYIYSFLLTNKHNNKNEFPHSSLSLKPYQMIGLNWLRIMHKQCKCITTHRVDVSTTTTTTKCIYRSAWYRRPWSNMRKTYKTMVL